MATQFTTRGKEAQLAPGDNFFLAQCPWCESMTVTTMPPDEHPERTRTWHPGNPALTVFCRHVLSVYYDGLSRIVRVTYYQRRSNPEYYGGRLEFVGVMKIREFCDQHDGQEDQLPAGELVTLNTAWGEQQVKCVGRECWLQCPNDNAGMGRSYCCHYGERLNVYREVKEDERFKPDPAARLVSIFNEEKPFYA